jgi:hypothetical protein
MNIPPGLAIVAGVGLCLLIGAYFWGRNSQKTEGFQTTAPPTIPNIPEEALKGLDTCKLLTNMLQSIETQIRTAEAGNTPPGQLELMKLTRGSMQQQIEALKCT